ncbi:MAG TPA: CRISPR-associated RAMP protein [Armatimonadetes bacterium]|nr:CRISPR-associated RAMP protein [Armatimonadota bacterium]
MTAHDDQAYTFETLRSQVSITGRLVSKTAFRIGTGRDIDAHTPDLPIAKDAFGQPFIPGSSMKGAVRSAVEAVVRAMKPGAPMEVACLCTGKPDDSCVPPALRKELVKQAATDQELAKLLRDHMCPVCCVFGSPWFAGKLRFRDLMLLTPPDRGPTSEMRDSVAIDRDTGTASSGQLFSYEVAPAGLAFDFHASLDNPSDTELGMALIGIKLLEQGDIRIGGGTSRGLGSCALEGTCVSTVEPAELDSLVGYLMGEPAESLSLDRQQQCIEDCLAAI